MSFKEIVGNNEVKEFLDKQIENNTIVHSYLFVGQDGIGKKIFAKEFARKLLCIDQEKTENCSSCMKWYSRKSS